MGLLTSTANGGMNSSPVCIPSQLRDIVIMVIYPPAYVFINEMYSSKPFDIANVIISFVLTCLFYFPGLFHSLNLLRNTGGINNN